MTNALNDIDVLAELLKSGADDLMLTTDQVAKLLGRTAWSITHSATCGRS